MVFSNFQALAVTEVVLPCSAQYKYYLNSTSPDVLTMQMGQV